MQYTSNLNLKKPESSDSVNIDDFNGNADILDTEVAKLATTSVAGRMSAADKVKLDGVAAGANNYAHPNHTGDVTSTGDGVTAIAPGVIVDADVNAGAAIGWSKISKSGSSLADLGTRSAADLSSGTLPGARMPAISGDITLSAGTTTAAITAGAIVNADINASAAIDASKIGGGAVSNTEFGYLDGVTSVIQTQIDSKVSHANGQISNLATTLTPGRYWFGVGATGQPIVSTNGFLEVVSLSGTNTEAGNVFRQDVVLISSPSRWYRIKNNTGTWSDWIPIISGFNYIRQPGFGPTSGSTTAYTLTLDPAPASYEIGMAVSILMHATNTGNASLDVNGLGAKNLMNNNGTFVATLSIGMIYTFRYNGFIWVLQ